MAGEYREPLIKALRLMAFGVLADLLECQDIKLAVTGSIRGNVKRREDLTPTFLKALALHADMTSPLVRKYYEGLNDGRFVPVENIRLNTEKIYAPGELFFTS